MRPTHAGQTKAALFGVLCFSRSSIHLDFNSPTLPFALTTYCFILMSTIPDFATKLKEINVLGAVSVERVSKFGIDGIKGFIVYVLLGPTGSGKSSFIEAVASNPSLGLSSDKLEGFTQTVSIYRIINAVRPSGSPIYLVDVPSFADSKISVMNIVSMLKDMLQTNKDLYGFRILYHTPINNPRLPGSQRQVLRTFEALTGPRSAERVTVISTMWDSIWNENTRRRAEGNFSQLRKEIWKDYIARGAKIVKFHNTQESALTILDDAWGYSWGGHDFNIQNSINVSLRESPFASHIYNDLQTRIHNLEMQQANIQSELQMATEQSDEKLRAVLIAQLAEVQILFTKFKEELHELGTPPDHVVTLEPAPTNDPADPLPAPSPTPGSTRSTLEAVTPSPEPLASSPTFVTPAVLEPITSTPDNKDDLQIWIQKLQTQQASIQSDLQMARVQQDEKLRAILIAQLEEAQVLFAKFKKELHEFGSLPVPNPPITLEPAVPQVHNPALLVPRLGGIITKATNRAKGWGNKLSKHKGSD
ncbi:hypothetical protein BJ165DRAFT_335900 [Panaeolus papilionaceus]|nr:hypothetical protein BJ165DRAFT_335900 [Panaeolus papilionaceus]